MPRSRSIDIQSERVLPRSAFALTWPASWIAPPNSSSFSVNVVLPASGWEMMAKVRRRSTSVVSGVRAAPSAGAPSGARMGIFMVTWMCQFRGQQSRAGWAGLQGRYGLISATAWGDREIRHGQIHLRPHPFAQPQPGGDRPILRKDVRRGDIAHYAGG